MNTRRNQEPCCLRGDRVARENCCGARQRRQQFKLINWSPVLAAVLQAEPKSDVRFLPEPNLEPAPDFVYNRSVLDAVETVSQTTGICNSETTTDYISETTYSGGGRCFSPKQ